jgi:NAD(P)-dependent dehydrogenase (short-subunit alcohol dehydrogenase family)
VVRLEAGTIEVLFANAGGGSFVPLGDITEEHYERTFATNVKGTLFTVQKALPFLRDGASVILTGSTTGVQCLQREQGGDSEFRTMLDTGSCVAAHSCQRVGSRRNREPGWHGLAESEEQDRPMQMVSRWDASALRTRRQVRRCLSRRTRAASSTAASYSWTAVPLRSEYQFICT